MSKYKDNWRDYQPPLVPAFHIEFESLEHMLTKYPESLSFEGAQIILGYFEEFEYYEKAALINNFIVKHHNKERNAGTTPTKVSYQDGATRDITEAEHRAIERGDESKKRRDEKRDSNPFQG